jgi:hypothetical protein
VIVGIGFAKVKDIWSRDVNEKKRGSEVHSRGAIGRPQTCRLETGRNSDKKVLLETLDYTTLSLLQTSIPHNSEKLAYKETPSPSLFPLSFPSIYNITTAPTIAKIPPNTLTPNLFSAPAVIALCFGNTAPVPLAFGNTTPALPLATPALVVELSTGYTGTLWTGTTTTVVVPAVVASAGVPVAIGVPTVGAGVGTAAPEGIVSVAVTVSPPIVRVLVVTTIGIVASAVGEAGRIWV